MLFFIRHGEKSAAIDVQEYMVYCPSCEGHCMADVMILSTYYHFFFVPIFPTGKEVNLICKKCGLKRYGAGFNSKTFVSFDEIKHLYRHPWFTYIGVGIAAIIALLTLYFSIVG
jgi:hypothetical protein